MMLELFCTCERGTPRSYWDTPERDSVADCLVHAVVPYYLVLCVSESKNTNIFPNGQIIYAINVPRSESKNRTCDFCYI